MYEQHKLKTSRQQEMNVCIKEYACDIADLLTRKDCEKIDLKCYNPFTEDDMKTYTPEAQEIFNEYYDGAMESLYSFVNRVVKTHKNK